MKKTITIHHKLIKRVMNMRVTNQSITNSYLADLNRNLEAMQKVQSQMSSEQLASKPSDDPLAVSKTMEVNTAISKNSQYSDNINDGVGWTETTDSALSSISDLLERVNELTISAGNETKTTADLNIVASEVGECISEFADIANTNYGGKYVFGGQNTTTAPFSVD